jgi:asparagine synthase (glutamine-hydrolysing)
MCGIAGIFAKNDGADAALLHSLAEKMGLAIATRGPDDSGVWTDASEGLALSHRRLSIIDLSPEGHQPMASASGRYVLVFNGEIYNYLELRDKLTYPWRGHSDTEVMLAAFEAWGVEAALKAMNGMFAFAVWDKETKTLTLARDRMGEKPLYYGFANNRFVFASELKAIATLPGWSPTINRDAIHLLTRYSYIPAPHSIYEGISKLMPAHFVQIKAGQRDLQQKPYWSLEDVAEYGLKNRFELSDSDATDELEKRLSFAVGQRMMSDVPLGAFLSGGVDSSIITALMQKQSNRPVKTFTIGFHEQGFNEAPFAKAVAQHLGTEHHEIYLSAQQALDVIPNLPTMYDEPFADSSQIPTYLVSHFARQHVTVALSGDGGDEVFGGYNRYVRGPQIWDTLSLIPRAIRIPAAKLMLALHTSVISKAVPEGNSHLSRLVRKLGNYYEKIGTPSKEEFFIKLVATYDESRALVIGGTLQPLLPNIKPLELTFAEWMMLQDALTYFPGDIMTKVDRASMAVSLETRTPFTDPDLIQFAWQLPINKKIRHNKGKWLLRQVLYRHVPEALIERPKSGFSIPLASWLRGPLKSWAADLLATETLKRQGYFDADGVQKLWNSHQSGKRDREHQLWNILMFQSWLQTKS